MRTRERFLVMAAAVILAAVLFATDVRAENCDTCHRHDLKKPGGQSLLVHPKVFAGTVHAGLLCSDCHKGTGVFPHGKNLEVRCDLPCHVAGASHAKTVEAIASGPHAGLGGEGKPGCLACHDSSKADGMKGKSGEELCLSCHGDKKSAKGRYPTDPGDFGRTAHEAIGGNRLTCAACHPAHQIKAGEAAKSCASASGCHDGKGPEFSALFSHGGKAGAATGLPAIGAILAAALCGLLAIRAARG